MSGREFTPSGDGPVPGCPGVGGTIGPDAATTSPPPSTRAPLDSRVSASPPAATPFSCMRYAVTAAYSSSESEPSAPGGIVARR